MRGGPDLGHASSDPSCPGSRRAELSRSKGLDSLAGLEAATLAASPRDWDPFALSLCIFYLCSTATTEFKSPAVSSSHCQRPRAQKLNAMNHLLEEVLGMENRHVSFTPLQFCLGIRKVTHLMRTTPV